MAVVFHPFPRHGASFSFFVRTTILTLLFPSLLQAQTMRDLFSHMPDSVMPVLSRNNRLDMIDFIDCGMRAEITNAFGGKSLLRVLTPTRIRLSLSSAVEEDVCLLPTADSSFVIMRLTTYAVGGRETSCAFFSPAWQELEPSSFLTPPQPKDFFSQEAKDGTPMPLLPLMEAELDDDGTTLVFRISLDDLSREERARVRPLLKDAITFRWNGRRFLLQP